MIITQVHLVLGTIKGHCKMCSFVTQHNATDVSSFEVECNWHADCRNVNQSCCQIIFSFLQRHFREFSRTSNRPYNRRPRVNAPPQDLHIQLPHLRDRLRPATRTADETVESSVCNKALCGEELILIGWAWLPSGWA